MAVTSKPNLTATRLEHKTPNNSYKLDARASNEKKLSLHWEMWELDSCTKKGHIIGRTAAMYWV